MSQSMRVRTPCVPTAAFMERHTVVLEDDPAMRPPHPHRKFLIGCRGGESTSATAAGEQERTGLCSFEPALQAIVACSNSFAVESLPKPTRSRYDMHHLRTKVLLLLWSVLKIGAGCWVTPVRLARCARQREGMATSNWRLEATHSGRQLKGCVCVCTCAERA
eukprot:3351410-Amphidinium_carterae.1